MTVVVAVAINHGCAPVVTALGIRPKPGFCFAASTIGRGDDVVYRSFQEDDVELELVDAGGGRKILDFRPKLFAAQT